MKTYIFIAAFLLLFVGCAARRIVKQNAAPPAILWAWERPENLEAIETDKFGVAFLSQTLVLQNDEMIVRPRRQMLKVADNTYLIAVTRIETEKRDANKRAELSDSQKEKTVEAILRTLQLKNIKAIQIDFDAAVSERNFYRNLLRDVRGKLPPDVGFTMTALASWCAGDNWISNLPVDEAVPMIFRMNLDDAAIRRFLAAGKDWSEPLCKQSYGISVDEPIKADFVGDRRFYYFNPRPSGWKIEDLSQLKGN